MSHVFCLMLTVRDTDEIARVRAYAEAPEHFDCLPDENTTCSLGLPMWQVHVTYALQTMEWGEDFAPTRARVLSMLFKRFGEAVIVPLALVDAVARYFGFTGSIEDWHREALHEHPKILMVAQPLDEQEQEKIKCAMH